MTQEPGLADFRGVWRLTRRIVHGDERLYTAEGCAVLAPDADGLRYRETGRLHLPGGGTLNFEQSYRWAADGCGIAVSFEDGRPFHRFSAHRSDDRHYCAPDTYDMLYDFALPAGWSTTCTVAGPKKGFVSVTRYQRAE